MKGIGTIGWEIDLPLPNYAIPKKFIFPNGEERDNPRYQGEVFFKKPINKAKISSFGVNTLSVHVNVKEPDLLSVNQNYFSGWISDHGDVVHDNGLIGLELNRRGNYDITFRFVPFSLYIGLVISLLSFSLISFLAYKKFY